MLLGRIVGFVVCIQARSGSGLEFLAVCVLDVDSVTKIVLSRYCHATLTSFGQLSKASFGYVLILCLR